MMSLLNENIKRIKSIINVVEQQEWDENLEPIHGYGEEIASGSEHKVFYVDDDFILKVPYWGWMRWPGQDILKEFDFYIKFMKSHPDIFPDVKKLDKRRASVERVDIDKAKKEIHYIFDVIMNHKNMRDEMYQRHGKDIIIHDLYNSSRPEVINTLERLKEYGKRNNDNIVLKWYNFIMKLKKTFKDRVLDIHAGNIGIDKQGNIKLIDY
jgi:hypothetical protein